MHCDWQGKFAWMPENLWQQLEPLLPKYPRRSKVGRPRNCAASPVVFFISCAPAASGRRSPPQFGSPSTVHRYFQEWTRLGIWRRFWKRALRKYDQKRGIAWRWQSVDGATTKSPLGGEKKREKSHRSR